MKKLIALFILCALTATGNAQSLTIQLAKTNITCYNDRNGSVNLTVSGGTTPYTFQWSNGATTEDINTLPPNYYAVTVTDAASNTATDGVTITEPAQIIYQFTTSDYVVNGTHYNLSSYTWHNGSISTNVSGGVSPYTYLWANGATTGNISSLDAGSYRITITDVTACSVLSNAVNLTKPDRSDWTMTGNTNTDPSTQFIGTTDAQDLSFRTNNSERLRIKANGDLKISSLASNANLYIDNNGILKGIPVTPNCSGLVFPAWSNDNTTNLFTNCDWVNVGIGLQSPYQKLHVLGNAVFSGATTYGITGAAMIHGNTGSSDATNPDYTWSGNTNTGIFHPGSNIIAFTNGGTESMRIIKDGNGNVFLGIGVGTSTQAFNSSDYKLIVNGKVGVRQDIYVQSGTGNWPDYVFSKDYQLKSLEEVNNFLIEHSHLPDMPSACEIEETGQPVGKIQQLQQQKIEELYLYIIKLQNQVDDLEKKLNK